MTASLRLEPSGPLPAPPDRGRLLAPEDVAQLLGRSPGWVRRHVPYKVTLGRSTVRWHEADVRAWLESLRPVTP